MGYTAASSLLIETSDAPEGTSSIAGGLTDDCVLVPLLSRSKPAVTDQLRVAASLSRSSDAGLYVVEPTSETPTAYGPDLSPAAERDVIERAVRSIHRTEQPGVLRTRTLLNGILSAIETTDVEALVVPSGSETGFLRQNLAERLALRAECDVVTVNGQQSYDDARSILLPVTGGPHSDRAADVTRRIAADTDAWVDILHVVPPRATDRRRDRATERVDTIHDRIGRPDRTTTWLLEAQSPADAIVEQSEYYGLTVLGAPTKGRLREFIAGSTSRTVRHGARSAVVSVRANQ
jgi:nucleotide-binding universal stress UspA family protein